MKERKKGKREDTAPRRGFTTGACSQAAARAAALAVATGYVPCEAPEGDKLKGDREKTGSVEITLPNGEQAAFVVTLHAEGVCSVIKDAGDDPDITNGLQIYVCVSARLDGRFYLDGAEGVGRVTLEGLPVKPGRAAINPVPEKFIRKEVKQILHRGADITISIPDGERLAVKTFNPRLGIVGGLSILGTTGRVEPWSEAAYQESLIPQLDIARAGKVRRPVLVPGAKGERAAIKAGYEDKQVMQMGNFAGMMLEAARERGFRKATLLGHAAKIAKLARGDFNTHSRRSPMPLDILADCAGESGWSKRRAQALMSLQNTEAAIRRIIAAGDGEIIDCAARRVAWAVKQDYGIDADVVLTDNHGEVVGRS
jgi:cobalt-precorrin-5B (C1)-methyltransferase